MKRIILAALAATLMLPSILQAQTPGPVTPGEAGTIIGSGLGKMSAGEVGSGLLRWLGDIMGMEIGTIMIDNVNYSKLTLTPEIRIGRLKLGLYLPVIYTSNIFDPTDWYHPEGNDEWSFGSGYWQTDPYTAALDALSDTALKIKYLEYGEQLVDPFFVKVGNLDSLTIGHGLLMRNYRNNTEFPAVRKVGFNLGIDAKSVGFEALVNDLAHPRLYGARLYARPFRNSKLAFGISGVLDTDPGRFLEHKSIAIGDMMFLGAGLDMDMPLIKAGGLFDLRAYAAIAATVPWVQTPFEGENPVEAGLKWNLVWNNGNPSNWGASTGFMGNILFLRWRLEYRYFTGLFRTSYFDSLYERNSGAEALSYVPYLDGTKSIGSEPTFSGVFGEAGFDIFKDKLVFSAGYLWPFTMNEILIDPYAAIKNDKLEASLKIKKGLIPLLDLSGSVYYTRRMFLYSIMQGNFTFFDTNSILSGELVVPVPKTPNLDVAFIFQTIIQRDPVTGAVIYVDGDPAKGVKVKPSIAIETRYHF